MKLWRRPLQAIRLFNINLILWRNRLDTVVLSTKTLQPYSFISYFNPWYWLEKKHRTRGENIRIALEQLGPIFVKFGQILSTRRDILPDDIADELEKLQDNVLPFPGELSVAIIEANYKKPLNEVFAKFNIQPLASASIAQVHAAELHNHQAVVVKIVRPNIEKIIRRDLDILYSVATLTEKFFPHGKQLRAREIVAEFEKSILYELDLLHEGANASQLRRNFLNSDKLYIPQIFWEYSSSNILVMERIDGIPISDIAALKSHNINLKKLAENGVEIFFTQVLRDSFFHADMHPGNIFVSKYNAIEPQYIAVDFGIMGNLSPIDQRYLAENLLAFFKRDYRRVAELHIESGRISPHVRVDEFETAIRGLSEPIFERPLKEISFAKLLLNLLQAAKQFKMEVQPQFFLLQKTLFNIEGLGRQLYPDLDLWSTAKPYIEKWVRAQLGPAATASKLYRRFPAWVDQMLTIPDLLHTTLKIKNAILSDTQQAQLRQEHELRRKRWLGVGIGFVVMALFNYFLMYFEIKDIFLANLILGFVGILIILLS
jgi:ubiquinone biosynthesis protein